MITEQDFAFDDYEDTVVDIARAGNSLAFFYLCQPVRCRLRYLRNHQTRNPARLSPLSRARVLHARIETVDCPLGVCKHASSQYDEISVLTFTRVKTGGNSGDPRGIPRGIPWGIGDGPEFPGFDNVSDDDLDGDRRRRQFVHQALERSSANQRRGHVSSRRRVVRSATMNVQNNLVFSVLNAALLQKADTRGYFPETSATKIGKLLRAFMWDFFKLLKARSGSVKAIGRRDVIGERR